MWRHDMPGRFILEPVWNRISADCTQAVQTVAPHVVRTRDCRPDWKESAMKPATKVLSIIFGKKF